jgi:colicin import membrane protein
VPEATTADALLPQRPGGLGPGAALSLVVHVGLVVALTLGVGWRMHAPEVVSAELWAALPQVAAPRVEEPPAPVPAPRPPPPAPAVAPAVPDAKIAIERDRKAREEKDKAEAAEKKKREAEDKKRELAARLAEQQAQKAEQARLDKLREDQMKRMLGTLSGSGAPTSTGRASVDAAPSSSYAGKLNAHIRPHIVFRDTLPGNPAAEVEVNAAPGGTVISRRLVKSSGIKEWDEAVLRAIDRTGTLPRDTDGRVPSPIIISFRPNE